MNKKSNKDSVVAFGGAGWFHIIYMLLMFWFYVGMINDGSNNIAGNIAEAMGTTAGNISNCNAIAGVLGVIIFLIVGVVNRKIGARMMSGINCIIAGITYMGVLNAPNTVVYTIMMAITCGTIMSAGYLWQVVYWLQTGSRRKKVLLWAIQQWDTTLLQHHAFYVAIMTGLIATMGSVNKASWSSGRLSAVIVLGIVGLYFHDEIHHWREVCTRIMYLTRYTHLSMIQHAADDAGWTTRSSCLKRDQKHGLRQSVTGVFQICSVGTMSAACNTYTTLRVSFGQMTQGAAADSCMYHVCMLQ